MSAQPDPPMRISASASPIPADTVGTIRMTLSVALLSAPTGQATMRLEGPKGLIGEGAFFALRYFIHRRARRAVVQAQRVTQASATRDMITVRIISDTMVQKRDARREYVHLGARARFLSGTEDDARIIFDVELADVSHSGAGLDSHVELARGDRLEIMLGDAAAEVEIVRCDPLLPVPFGARFVDRLAGEALFATALEAIWTPPRLVAPAGPGEIAIDGGRKDSTREGMRTRRPRGQ